MAEIESWIYKEIEANYDNTPFTLDDTDESWASFDRKIMDKIESEFRDDILEVKEFSFPILPANCVWASGRLTKFVS